MTKREEGKLSLKEAERIVQKAKKEREKQKEIEEREYRKSLVGRYFIYRGNSYGCSEPNLKWNVYLKVIDYGKDWGITAIEFENIDKKRMKIEVHEHYVYGTDFRYEEITKEEFEKGKKDFMKRWGDLL